MEKGIRLDGLVLRSQNIDKLCIFYEALLYEHFKEEKHGNGPRHYSTQQQGIFFELYPTDKLTPSSTVALGFYSSSPAALIDRLQGLTTEPIIFHNENTVATFRDPEGRNIRVHQQNTESGAVLNEIFLHGDIERMRSFYQDLLGVAFAEEQDQRLPKEYGKHYSYQGQGLALRLQHDRREWLPDPSLFFEVGDLYSTLQRMKKHIKPDKKEFNDLGVQIFDPHQRPIYLREVDF